MQFKACLVALFAAAAYAQESTVGVTPTDSDTASPTSGATVATTVTYVTHNGHNAVESPYITVTTTFETTIGVASPPAFTATGDISTITNGASTETVYYVTRNPIWAAESPEITTSTVVISTSGMGGGFTLTDVKTIPPAIVSNVTTTYTTENHIHAAESQYFTITTTYLSTLNINEIANQSAAAGMIAARAPEVGGIAAFVLGLAAMLY